MAKSTTPSSLDTVTRFYKALSLQQPSPVMLSVLAQRVDSGSATYGEVLKTLYTSATVMQESPADELVRMFFLAFNRAPDAPLFGTMMDMLRGGSTLADLAGIVLGVPGFALSDAGYPRHGDFVSALLGRALGAFSPVLAQQLTDLLDAGLSRAQMLAVVSGLPSLATAPPDRVETALLYLAGAGREASVAELATQPATTDGRIIAALAAGGLSATGGELAFHRQGNAVRLYGDLAGDLVWNAALGRYTLAGKSAFKVFYSLDGGLSGSVVDFNAEMARGVTSIDAADAVGKGKLVFTAGPSQAVSVIAPVGGSSLLGTAQADRWLGSAGADTIFFTGGRDTATGGLGDDRFVLPDSTVYQAGGAPVTITDFGVGKDQLDFSRLLNKSVDISALTARLATDAPGLVLANGAVVLVENNGAWVSGAGASLVSRAATAADVLALFGPGKLFRQPTQVNKSVVITADTRNSADVWLILNNTDVTQVTDGMTGPQEIFHVAHLEGSWNASLVGTLPVPLDPVLGV